MIPATPRSTSVPRYSSSSTTASHNRARTCSRRRRGAPRAPGRGPGRSGCRARGRRRRRTRLQAGVDAPDASGAELVDGVDDDLPVRRLTPGRLFITRLTVASLTPARWATSRHRTRTDAIVPSARIARDARTLLRLAASRGAPVRLPSWWSTNHHKGVIHAHSQRPCRPVVSVLAAASRSSRSRAAMTTTMTTPAVTDATTAEGTAAPEGTPAPRRTTAAEGNDGGHRAEGTPPDRASPRRRRPRDLVRTTPVGRWSRRSPTLRRGERHHCRRPADRARGQITPVAQPRRARR